MSTEPADRSAALDALRGLAILLMVFSGKIPYGVLPEWMYHAQVPPPAHVFNGALPGITWVDLVFPFFLFALGAAIPLALNARLVRGDSMSGIVASIFKRGALLFFFAVFVQHLKPGLMSGAPQSKENLLALAGFALLFPVLAALPRPWGAIRCAAVRAFGWIGVIAVLIAFRAKDGGAFSLARSDIIMLVLANVAVSGALIWLATRHRLDWRVGILVFLLALRLTQSLPGWGQWTWNLSPWPWLGTLYFQQYLFIVIPGTIAGDLLLRWRASSVQSRDARPLHAVALPGVVACAVALVGLKGRWVVETTVLTMLLAAAGAWLARGETFPPVLRSLIHWGAFWLLLGLAFEPFEGGIRKDRATLSYYFVTSGLACWLLVSLTIAIDLAQWRRGFGLLIGAGRNPLIAYAGATSLLPPTLAIVGLEAAFMAATSAPWAGVVRAACATLLLAWLCAWLARKNVLLKT
jgi:predicted acyltransferase